MIPRTLRLLRDDDLEEFFRGIGVDYDELQKAAATVEETDATAGEGFIVGFAIAMREVLKIVDVIKVPQSRRPMTRRPGLDRRWRK